jgi:hypothetical protein
MENLEYIAEEKVQEDVNFHCSHNSGSTIYLNLLM